MKKFISLFLFLSLALLAGCDRSQEFNSQSAIAPAISDEPSETQSVFQYVGYSRDGAIISRGKLFLTVNPSTNRVTGRWELRALADTTRIGPQNGRGKLVGTFAQGGLSLNLQPLYADNNIILTGRFDRTTYAGKWEWVTFVGVRISGTFRASRAATSDLAE